MSAQAKPISEVVKEFEQSLENLRPSTRRVYVAVARSAIRALTWNFGSALRLMNWNACLSADLGTGVKRCRAAAAPIRRRVTSFGSRLSNLAWTVL